jgi:hypothetical protein
MTERIEKHRSNYTANNAHISINENTENGLSFSIDKQSSFDGITAAWHCPEASYLQQTHDECSISATFDRFQVFDFRTKHFSSYKGSLFIFKYP